LCSSVFHRNFDGKFLVDIDGSVQLLSAETAVDSIKQKLRERSLGTDSLAADL
jgi:hypothetical protein